jgi:general secretion pathway protein M
MTAMGSDSTSSAPGGLSAARATIASLRGRWLALAPRERRGLTLAGGVLGVYLIWALAFAPAWRTLAAAPGQLDALALQTQQMKALAAESATLRAVPPVPIAQSQAALSAATARVGAPARLSLQGERAILSLKGISGAQLGAWLAEARRGARARVVEANLTQSGPGLYDGSLTVALRAGQ